MKRVAIQQGLEEIKQKLKKEGYEVVNYEDRGHIDAIVYKSIDNSIQNVNNSESGNLNGAILINANNKTIEEIKYIIETRKYGNLFT